jgi:hypothetical protein
MAQELFAEDVITTLTSERPLLRQPLGFSIDKPAQSINTYEASLPVPIKNGVFLPGQVVPKPKKSKTNKRSSNLKRPKRPEAYAGQTSKFRLETYPTPIVELLIHNGSEPNSSMHRSATPTTESRPDLPATATASLQGQPSSSTASSNTMDSFGQFSSLRSSQENSCASKGKAAASEANNTQPVAAAPFSCTKFRQSTNENIGSTSVRGPYYRRNYESQHVHATSLLPLPILQRQPTQSETQNKWSPVARSQRHLLAASTSSRGTDNEEAEGLELNHILDIYVCVSDILSLF